MQESIKKLLISHADFMAVVFSDKERKGNFNQEDFRTKEIVPMSDLTATIIYEKSKEGVVGKDAVAFAYYSKNQDKVPGDKRKPKKWHIFFPTDTQLAGFMRFDGVKSFGKCDNVEVDENIQSELTSRVNQMILDSAVPIVADEIIPMSLDTATVKIKEEKNGTMHYLLFYRVKSGGWRFFKVEDSHISGFRKLESYKHDVEEYNYDKNYKTDSNVES